MSEITLSEAGQAYERARRVFSKVANAYGEDSAEARLADEKMILSKLTFEGLGGRLPPVDDYYEQLNRENEAILAKLNSHS